MGPGIRHLFWMLLLGVGGGVVAQDSLIFVVGSVLDSADRPIAGATVVALAPADSSYLGYSIGSESGTFSLALPAGSDYLLKISSLGYAARLVRIPAAELGNRQVFRLQVTASQIQQITVRDKAPMHQRGDTIVYRGAAYRDSTERKVGELLKKLPGVEVDVGGRVTVNGKAIRTMLIDGDNLLGHDYAVLTHNLSADVVEDIEVIFNYLENPLLGTVYESRDIAVNLQMAQNKRRRVNLTAAGGVGTRGRYDVDINAIALYDRLTSVNLLRAGNIGTPLPYLDGSPTPPLDFPITAQVAQDVERLFPTDLTSNRIDPTRINTTAVIHSITSYRTSDDWRIKGSLTLPYEDYRQVTTTVFDYLSQGEDAFQRSIRRTGRHRLYHYGLDLRKAVRDKTYLVMTGGLHVDKEERRTEFDSNERFDVSPQQRAFGGRAQLTQKLARYSLAVFDIIYTSANETADVVVVDSTGDIALAPAAGDQQKLIRHQTYRPRAFSASGSFLHRIGETLLSLGAGSATHRLATDLEGDPAGAFAFRQSEAFLRGQIQHRFGKSQLAAVLQAGRLGGRVSSTALDRRDYLNVTGTLAKRWSPVREWTLELQRTDRLPDPTVSVPYARYTSRYQVTRGHPAVLDRLNHRHSIRTEFTTGRVFPYRLFSVFTSYQWGRDGYLPNYRLIGNTSLTEYLPRVRDYLRYAAGGRGEYLVTPLSSTLKFQLNYGGGNYTTGVEVEEVRFSERTVGIQSAVRTGIDWPLNVEVGIDYTRSRTRSGDRTNDFTAVTTIPYLDLLLLYDRRLSGRWSTNWQVVDANTTTARNLISDLHITYRLAGTLSRIGITISNVFNNGAITSSRVFEYGQITQSAEILPRYVMLRGEASW